MKLTFKIMQTNYGKYYQLPISNRNQLLNKNKNN